MELGSDLEAFRAEVRAFFREQMDPARTRAHRDPSDLTGFDEAFERELLRRCGERGYLGVSLPEAYGGGGRPLSHQAVFGFEAAYAGAPAIDTPVTLVASQLLAFGSAEQKDRHLPAMIRGEGLMCIAYTEPEAGSDLSRVATRAVPAGEGFALTGTKSLVTAAHKADHVCLVARTDPDAKPRDAMSMFLFELDRPGVSISRQETANGWTLGEIRFKAAAIPADALLGTLHGGWSQMAAAIESERSGMFHLGWATRGFEALCEACRDPRQRAAPREVVRQRLAALACELDVARRFVFRVLREQDGGRPGPSATAMAKISTTELLQRIAQAGTELLGPLGLLRPEDPRAPASGRFAYDVIEHIHPAISVGSNEIQRNAIATAGLRLPRG